MARRPRLRMSNAEAARYAREAPLHCPKETCDGHVTQMGLSPGHKECCTCGRRWDFVDARGQSVSRQEYDALVAARSKRRVERSLPPSIGMEDEMAAKKKAKKAAKKTGAKKVDVPFRLCDAFLGLEGKTVTGKYKGEEYRIDITSDGYVYGGKKYSSLSKLAVDACGKPGTDFLTRAADTAVPTKSGAKKVVKKVAKKKAAKK